MQFTKNHKAKILVVDDHPIVRQGIALMINREAELEVCHSAETAEQAIAMNTDCPHDLIILDLSLAGISGLDLLREMRSRFPSIAILIMSMHDEAIYAERLLHAGARGYLMKQEATDTILLAIRKILKGGLYLSSRMQDLMLQQNVEGGGIPSPLASLTAGEFEILHLLGMGLGTNEIATRLNRSIKTVDTHRASIRRKLRLSSSSALTHFAINWVNGEGLHSENPA